jgi:hypothetical protein
MLTALRLRSDDRGRAAAARPRLSTRQIVQEEFNAIVFDHCYSSRHGFSQGVNLFGVQHLI